MSLVLSVMTALKFHTMDRRLGIMRMFGID